MDNIEQLKRYVVQSKDLREPLNYFFDLTDANAFSKIKSHRAVKKINQHTELMAVVQITHERFGKFVKQLTPIFYEIPEHHFFHGVCLSSNLVMPLVIIYFSDIKTGISAIASSQTDMMRFSLMKQSDIKEKH